jgi:hypothetical protein
MNENLSPYQFPQGSVNTPPGNPKLTKLHKQVLGQLGDRLSSHYEIAEGLGKDTPQGRRHIQRALHDLTRMGLARSEGQAQTMEAALAGIRHPSGWRINY